MALTIEVWEDSGPLSAGAPTVRQKVSNLGWKDSSLDESYPYYDYPIQRPYGINKYDVSYIKYYYFKVSGTWTGEIVTPYLQLFYTNGGAQHRITYNLTSTYTEQDNSLLNGTQYQEGSKIFPLWNTTGDPRDPSTFRPTLTSGSSYTSNYFATQIYTDPGTWTDYGNIGDDGYIDMKLSFQETLTLYNFHQYDPTDPDDPALNQLKWSW